MISQHLFQRGKRGTWHVRIAVPRQRQTLGGPRERIKSLGTTDRQLAERKALPIIAAWRAEWDAGDRENTPATPAITKHMPSVAEIEQAAVEWGYDQYTDFIARSRKQLRGVSPDKWAEHVTERKAKLALRAQQVATGDFSQIAPTARRIADRLGWEISTNSDDFGLFCRHLATASLDAHRVTAAEIEGQYDAAPASPLVQEVKKRTAAKAKPGEAIMELFEQYARECVSEGDKRADGIAPDRVVIAQFAEFVGKDRAPSSITRDDAVAYRDALPRIPTSYSKKKDYRGLNIHQAIEKADRLNANRLSTITQARYLSTVSPFFKWLNNKNKISSFPFAGLTINTKKIKGKNPRPPLDKDQLNTILKSPLFTGFLAHGEEHRAGNKHADDWRYWIPLVCLFTGARIGEIAQLLVNDVRKVQDAYFIFIKEDEKTNQRTKSKQGRHVAVHPTLEKLGFVEFVNNERAILNLNGEQDRPLFPEIKPDKRGQVGATPSRFWRDYLAAIGAKRGADGIGTHSFRHTMADELRKANYRDDEIGALILGHSNKTVTSGYGQLREGTAQMILEMISSVKFEGVEFEHLIPAEKPTSH
ncbi:DUF6538 domain-containing protein [Sphingosinicella sp.]|uniref:DUF6538 domain-containing protein n=1 Tax=Sphingosinicella sp. TaxID=1917971 RepID=UPI0017F967B3|nr:DUF6538 domain-containing protein [Sphingosinicella sp.]MBA4757412.1 tyrosine-type recombinase/integrase [Sphingosinicella sp.]